MTPKETKAQTRGLMRLGPARPQSQSPSAALLLWKSSQASRLSCLHVGAFSTPPRPIRTVPYQVREVPPMRCHTAEGRERVSRCRNKLDWRRSSDHHHCHHRGAGRALKLLLGWAGLGPLGNTPCRCLSSAKDGLCGPGREMWLCSSPSRR